MRLAWILILTSAALPGADGPARNRITLLYDSHAVAPLVGGWGYSALVEYRGKRILFDAGGSADSLAKNVNALGIDLGRLDAVVISHDDPDHYAGLDYVYTVNRTVKVYVPDTESGAFATSILNRLYRLVERAVPGRHVVDPPRGANYVPVRDGVAIFPGARLISLPFDSGQRREQALVLDVPGGIVLLTGCAHPGIVELAKRAGVPVKLAAGGFHLTASSQADVRRTVQQMKGAKVESAWPAHCTGRFATEELRRVYGPAFGTVAVGGVIPLGRD